MGKQAHLAEISWMKLRMGLRACPVRSSTRVAMKLSAEAQGEAYESWMKSDPVGGQHKEENKRSGERETRLRNEYERTLGDPPRIARPRRR